MLRRATLQLRGYIFLQPEHVDGLTEYPFYASVTALTSETATIRSLGLDDPITCNIDTDMARTLTVSKLASGMAKSSAWTAVSLGFNWKTWWFSLSQRGLPPSHQWWRYCSFVSRCTPP
ncbi:hypothetical protein PR002_g523 [Phytophthora rubi]|uniref:Uncharacterized protein n=1 Tax=Phytophthora rubi TaxID=129364 RepID=A0A6A3NYY3_9STRA|nr:hypothetical protein PR002_g523 [Phytophthora rubi]